MGINNQNTLHEKNVFSNKNENSENVKRLKILTNLKQCL